MAKKKAAAVPLTRAQKVRIIKDKLLQLFVELNEERVMQIDEEQEITALVNGAAGFVELAIAIRARRQ